MRDPPTGKLGSKLSPTAMCQESANLLSQLWSQPLAGDHVVWRLLHPERGESWKPRDELLEPCTGMLRAGRRLIRAQRQEVLRAAYRLADTS